MIRFLPLPIVIPACCFAAACVAGPMPLPEPATPTAMSLPVCADSMPITGDTTGIGLHPPVPLQVVMPEVSYRRLNGIKVTIRHLVNTAGRVDSVVVLDGVEHKKDIEALEKAGMATRYAPAWLNGCRLRGWSTGKMTFSR